MYVHPSVVAARQPFPQFETAGVALALRSEATALFRRTLDVNDVVATPFVDPASMYGSLSIQDAAVSPNATTVAISYKPLGVNDVTVGIAASAANAILAGGLLYKQDPTIQLRSWPAELDSRNLLKRDVRVAASATSAAISFIGTLDVQDVTVAASATSITLEVAALSVQDVTLSPTITSAAVEGDFTVQDVAVGVAASPTTIYEPIFTVQDVDVGIAATTATLEDRNFDVQDVAVAVSATPVAVEGELSVNDVTVIADATSARIYSGVPAGVRALWHFEESPAGLGPDGNDWTNIQDYGASRFGHGVTGDYSFPVGQAVVLLTNPIDPATESFTLEAWLCVDIWNMDLSRVVFFADGDEGRPISVYTAPDPPPNPTYETVGVGFNFTDNLDNFYFTGLVTQIDIPAAFHAAVTWDHTTSTVQGYVNGELVASHVTTAPLRLLDKMLWSGGILDYQGGDGVVSLDEVRLSEGVIYTGDPITVPTEPFIPQLVNVLQARRPYTRVFSTSAAIEYKTLSVNDVVLQSAITPVEVYDGILKVNDVTLQPVASSVEITVPPVVVLSHHRFDGTTESVLSAANDWVFPASNDTVYSSDLAEFSQAADVRGSIPPYALILDTFNIRETAFTFEAWISAQESGHAAGTYIEVAFLKTSTNITICGWAINKPTSGNWQIRFYAFRNGLYSLNMDTGYPVTADMPPVHVAIVYDNLNTVTEQQIFIDGVRIQTYGSIPGTAYIADRVVGSDSDTLPASLKFVDELRLTIGARYDGPTYTVPTEPFPGPTPVNDVTLAPSVTSATITAFIFEVNDVTVAPVATTVELDTYDLEANSVTISPIVASIAIFEPILDVRDVTSQLRVDGQGIWAAIPYGSLPTGVNPGALDDCVGWIDLADGSTVWTDTAGTVQAENDGDSVLRVDDKSGAVPVGFFYGTTNNRFQTSLKNSLSGVTSITTTTGPMNFGSYGGTALKTAPYTYVIMACKHAYAFDNNNGRTLFALKNQINSTLGLVRRDYFGKDNISLWASGWPETRSEEPFPGVTEDFVVALKIRNRQGAIDPEAMITYITDGSNIQVKATPKLPNDLLVTTATSLNLFFGDGQHYGNMYEACAFSDITHDEILAVMNYMRTKWAI